MPWQEKKVIVQSCVPSNDDFFNKWEFAPPKSPGKSSIQDPRCAHDQTPISRGHITRLDMGYNRGPLALAGSGDEIARMRRFVNEWLSWWDNFVQIPIVGESLQGRGRHPIQRDLIGIAAFFPGDLRFPEEMAGAVDYRIEHGVAHACGAKTPAARDMLIALT